MVDINSKSMDNITKEDRDGQHYQPTQGTNKAYSIRKIRSSNVRAVPQQLRLLKG